jgi:hypothetical protein
LLEFSLELLLLVAHVLQFILTRSKFPLSGFSIASPLLNLSPELALKLQFLFLDILNIMLQLDVVILVLKLSLSILFVLSTHHSFLLKIFGLEILS